jgi:hypothetical protein
MYLRDFLDSLELGISHFRDLTRVKALPSIILDKPYTLKNFCSQSYTLVGNLDHLLSLSEHDLD